MTSSNTVRVLLIEDNPGDRRLIREMLVSVPRANIQLAYATTLAEGITAVDTETFDAVLLDLSLPDSLGVHTLNSLRQHAPHIAIVVLTGFDDQTMGVQAVQAGAQDYLMKGETDSRLLSRTLLYAIERHRNEEALRRSEQEYRSLIDDVFDTSTVSVLILDGNYTVVWCNSATENYFGMERVDIIGRDKRVLIEDKLRCAFSDPDSYSTRILEGYTAGTFTTRLECHVIPEGDRLERWLEYWSQPIRAGRYNGGRIEQYTDITNRKQLELAEQEQRRYAEALSEVAALLTSTLDLEQVLERIVSALASVVPHDSANIMLLQNDRIMVIRDKNVSSIDLSTDDSVTVNRLSPVFQMLRTRQPVTLSSLTIHQSQMLAADQDPNMPFHSYVGVPIMLRKQVNGFINVFSHLQDAYNTPEIDRLIAFAQQAAIAIENARLYSESQQLAALEERQRLARELHDSVSQTLFTATAMAESALRQWDNSPPRAFGLLQDVHQLNRAALAEMRVLLLELRPSSLTNISLKQLLEQYLKPIQVRRELDITVTIPDDLRLPPKVQMGMYRIVQEIFNNIDKHAQATMVYTSVIESDSGIELVIRDNGRGFEDGQVEATSLGLQIMQERAAEIGATMDISSTTGQGTRISLLLPSDKYKGQPND